MALEPTLQERQHRAFEILREQARAAHCEGDGLRAGHLSEIALQELRHLAKQKQLSITIREVQWAFVFQLYWLLHGYTIHFTRETLRQVPRANEKDDAVFQILETYAFFIEQPLMGAEKASERLRTLSIQALGDDVTPELTELVIHLVELAWYHLVSTGVWQEIAHLWIQSGPSWIGPLLKPVQERLQVQTRITVPSKANSPFELSAAAAISKISVLGELWLLHLYGRADAMLQRIKEITPKLNPDDNQWRLIADFWHVNPSLSTTSSGDPQGVWLARRRQMTTGFPALVFHDRREVRIRELLGDVYRRGKEGSASDRWQILQLAMLHEMAALRMWDFGMWREAVRAQSETLLEAGKWRSAEPGFSAQGLVTGVRAISLGSADKDPLVRAAIHHIEFAPEPVLADLSTDLFFTYPRQKYTASGLFGGIGDLVPAGLWAEFAVWTAAYAEESRQNITSGFELNPLKPWADILPLVTRDSTVWVALRPEVLRLAGIRHCWRGDDRGILWSWMIWSPSDAAREVAETMVSVISADAGESLSRAELLASFERERPEVGNVLTRELFTRPQSPEERLLLACHLNDPSANSIEDEVRAKTIRSLHNAIDQAVPPEGSTTFSFGPFVPGVTLLHEWRDEHEPLLRDLVNATSSPEVLRNWIPTLLNWIQLIVAYGPRNFAEFVEPFVGKWVKQLPLGKEVLDDAYGPFSIMQMRGIGGDDITEALGWICFQLLRKLKQDAHAVVRVWIQSTLFIGDERPMPIAFYVAIVLATQMSGEGRLATLAAADAILLSLRIRMKESNQAAMNLADALRYTAGIIGKNDSEIVSWESDAGKATLEWLTDFLDLHARVLASAVNPQLRAELALLLWNMNRKQILSPVLSRILEELSLDRRARVRVNANGGEWELLRIRRTQKKPERNHFRCA